MEVKDNSSLGGNAGFVIEDQYESIKYWNKYAAGSIVPSCVLS